MVQIPSWLHSTFKELSNEYSHAQIRVKTKKLWARQAREEKPVAVQKLMSRPDLMSRPELMSRPDVATRFGVRPDLVSRPDVATRNAAET